MIEALAQTNEISRSFREYLSRKAEWPLWLGLAFLIIIVAVAIRLIWPLLRRSRAAEDRFGLFASIHNLSRADRRALRKMGRVRFPDDPALIFVSPSTFDAMAAGAGLDPSRADSLKQKLYS